MAAIRRTQVVRLTEERTAPQHTRRAGFRTDRIDGLFVRVLPIPVGAPLPHVARQVAYASFMRIHRVDADRSGGADPHLEIGMLRCGILVPPGILPTLGSPGDPFPLRLGGKPAPRPATVRIGFVPGDASDRPVGMSELHLPISRSAPFFALTPRPTFWVPVARAHIALIAGLEKPLKLRYGHRVAPDPQLGHRNPVRRRFVLVRLRIEARGIRV